MPVAPIPGWPEVQLPDGLPAFLAKPHNITRHSPFADVPMMAGAARRRRTLTRAWRVVEAEMDLTHAQAQTFFQFWRFTIRKGELAFVARVANLGPGVSYCRARFVEPPRPEPMDGLSWRVRVKMVLDGDLYPEAPQLSGLSDESVVALLGSTNLQTSSLYDDEALVELLGSVSDEFNDEALVELIGDGELVFRTFRYWRLYITAADSSGTWYSLSRLKLMDGATDRALSYTATDASGSVDPVTNAFDDNISTEWTNNTVPAPVWIAVDLGAAYTLTEYRITSQRVVTGRTPATWELQGSNTSLTGPWSAVDARSGQTGWGIQETRTFTIT